MKLIHLTDLHLMPPGELLWGLDPFARFDAALVDIAAHHADADLCVITGDLTEKGDVAAYELLRTEGSETILILDDVFAELDTARRRALAAVATAAEQVLITAAVDSDIPPDLDATRIAVTMTDGESGRQSGVQL